MKRFVAAFAVLALALPEWGGAGAATVTAAATLPAAGKPDKKHDAPACEGQTEFFADSIGRRIVNKGVDAVNDAVARLDVADDPLNSRSRAGAACMDVCATLPAEAAFTAKGSIKPIGWEGTLPSEDSQRIEPQDAVINGPVIRPAGRSKVVCYTFINQSRKQERHIEIQLTY